MSAIQVFTRSPIRLPFLTRHFTQSVARLQEASNVPRVASPSLWHAVIPKAFRRPSGPVSVAEREKLKSTKSKEWNPATFFIAIAILIGSNAIQMIALRNERLHFSRRTDAHLQLLRETIQRVRDGEHVDIEKTLGSGDPAREQEWEEVMREIEQDDALWQARKRKREQRAQQQSAQQTTSESTPPPQQKEASNNATPRAPGFY